jgi:hypothetical protein
MFSIQLQGRMVDFGSTVLLFPGAGQCCGQVMPCDVASHHRIVANPDVDSTMHWPAGNVLSYLVFI